MRDPEDAAPAQDTLRELFGLTRTEAAITAALAEGHGLAQIAAQFHIGLGTVRSHLKTILAKTGTHRQAQLVALVAHSVASIATVSVSSQPHQRHAT
jgi:DNA-binding CsgD family transcriptional regulator